MHRVPLPVYRLAPYNPNRGGFGRLGDDSDWDSTTSLTTGAGGDINTSGFEPDFGTLTITPLNPVLPTGGSSTPGSGVGTGATTPATSSNVVLGLGALVLAWLAMN